MTCGKRLSLILLLFVLVLAPCYSDYLLSDEDMEAVTAALNESENQLIISKTEIETQKTQLINSTALIQALKTQTETQEHALTRLSMALVEEKKSYQKQNINNLLIGSVIGGAIIGSLWLYCELKD